MDDINEEGRRERALEFAMQFYGMNRDTPIIQIAKEFEQFLKGEKTNEQDI